jgi:Skp family chaperone for outer membrane proteins
MKKTFLIIFLFVFNISNVFSDSSYFIDFNQILNKSKAGISAQENLKKKFENESNKFKKQEVELKKNENNLISQKKLITNEEYKKKVQSLRKKVAELQKNKNKSLQSISESRRDARQNLLKVVNPIIKKYMEENNIRMIVEKQSVIMGDASLEITSQILAILNKELTSIKIN